MSDEIAKLFKDWIDEFPDGKGMLFFLFMISPWVGCMFTDQALKEIELNLFIIKFPYVGALIVTISAYGANVVYYLTTRRLAAKNSDTQNKS